MRGTIRKSMIAATALLVIAGTTMALPNAANARWGGGWHGGGWHGWRLAWRWLGLGRCRPRHRNRVAHCRCC